MIWSNNFERCSLHLEIRDCHTGLAVSEDSITSDDLEVDDLTKLYMYWNSMTFVHPGSISISMSYCHEFKEDFMQQPDPQFVSCGNDPVRNIWPCAGYEMFVWNCTRIVSCSSDVCACPGGFIFELETCCRRNGALLTLRKLEIEFLADIFESRKQAHYLSITNSRALTLRCHLSLPPTIQLLPCNQLRGLILYRFMLRSCAIVLLGQLPGRLW